MSSLLHSAVVRLSHGCARRVGVLSLGVPNDDFSKKNIVAFVQSLNSLGWKDGANVVIDWHWYGTDAALAERQAAEIVAMKPDVIFAVGNPSVERVRLQTRSIPVVFTLVSDPVGMGYVDSLARPGGNVTGFMTYDPPIYTKQLQMLTQITPPVRTVAVLYNPQTAPYASHMLAAMEPAAQSMGVTLRPAPCHDETEIEAVMISLEQGRGGLLTIAEIFNQLHGQVIGNLALKYKIPVIVFTPQMIESGGLIAYTVDLPDLFTRSATYVDRILKGGKARRSTRPSAHKIWADHQLENRQGAQCDNSAGTACDCRRGDRIAVSLNQDRHQDRDRRRRAGWRATSISWRRTKKSDLPRRAGRTRSNPG